MRSNTKLIGIGLICLAVILGLLLIVVKINFDSQAVFLCEAVQADPTLEMKDCPAHTSSIPWLLIIAFGIAFLMLGAGIYLLVSQKKPTITTKNITKEIDISTLNDDEKKIYLYIKEKGGSAYQSEIIKATEINKVKMTRILDSMEHDHRLVERKRRGMTNIDVLK